jgi:hypothetical protein
MTVVHPEPCPACLCYSHLFSLFHESFSVPSSALFNLRCLGLGFCVTCLVYLRTGDSFSALPLQNDGFGWILNLFFFSSQF